MMHGSNRHSVICDGDALRRRLANAPQHLTARPHARAAMNDNRIFGKILRELRSTHKVNDDIGTNILANPIRNLRSANIILDRVMRTRLSNENFIARFELHQCPSPRRHRRELALESRKEYRKPRQRDIVGNLLAHLLKRLRIGHDDRWWLAQKRKRLRHVVFTANRTRRMRIEYIANRLNLRHDEATLGRLLVDRYDEQYMAILTR